MPAKHYLNNLQPYTIRQATSASRQLSTQAARAVKIAQSLLTLTLLATTHPLAAQAQNRLMPYDYNQTGRRLMPANTDTSPPQKSAPNLAPATNPDAADTDQAAQDTMDDTVPTEFMQVSQPQSTPALNVIVPAERPPIPTPPPVALPPVARTDVKAPESWRIKANNLFKTVPDKAKVCQSIYTGNLSDAINSIVQTFKQQGFKIGEVNARSGHILVMLDNFARTSNGPSDGYDRRDAPAATSKERVIIAVRTNTPNQDCEIRALVDGRNKILNMDKVRQIFDQLKAAPAPDNNEML